MENTENPRLRIETEHIKDVSKFILILGIPFASYSSIVSFKADRYVSGFLLIAISLTLLLLLIVQRKEIVPYQNSIFHKVVFFAFLVFLGAELIYLIGFLGFLSRIPWFYLFPLIIFNAVGHKKGVIWVTLLLVLTGIFWLYYPLAPVLELEELRTRFVITIVMISFLSFLAERYRHQKEEELILNQQILINSEKTLRETNELLEKEIERRKQTEEHLEQLVKDRTTDLERTNQLLVQEIKEREQAEIQRIKLEEQLRVCHKINITY